VLRRFIHICAPQPFRQCFSFYDDELLWKKKEERKEICGWLGSVAVWADGNLGMDTTLMMMAIFICFLHVYFGKPMWYHLHVHLWVVWSWEIKPEKYSSKNGATKSVEHFYAHIFPLQIHNCHTLSLK
jgi:hypothetical protein